MTVWATFHVTYLVSLTAFLHQASCFAVPQYVVDYGMLLCEFPSQIMSLIITDASAYHLVALNRSFHAE